MLLQKNDGSDTDKILQNTFTAYLLSAVRRRKALYIENIIKDQQVLSLIEDSTMDCRFDIEQEALDSIPLYMRLQNEKLFSALTMLSERERYVFYNRALEEKSLEELANEVGLSYKGVAAIYYRTIKKIRNYMKGE